MACAGRITATSARSYSHASAARWPLGGVAPAARRTRTPRSGTALLDEARAAYRTILANVPVTQHRNFPITVDEIVGAVPPLARKGLGGTRP